MNGSIITDKYGSYVFIGYIVTNLDIEKMFLWKRPV